MRVSTEIKPEDIRVQYRKNGEVEWRDAFGLDAFFCEITGYSEYEMGKLIVIPIIEFSTA